MIEFTGYTKGVNLGGWLSQCGEDNYNDTHYSTFITKDDIKAISSWNTDHVRLPIDYNVVQNEDGSFIEKGFGYIDNCIEWCNEYNLNIVLDLHKTLGYVFDDANYCSFFYDENMQNIFIKLWQEFAKKYGHLYKNIAFELLNEITDPKTADKWNEISRKAIIAIREIAPEIKIIVGGIYNNSIYGLELLEKPYDENIIFTFHTYSPLIFTHQNAQWIEKMPSDLSIKYPETADVYLKESQKVFGNDFDKEFNELQNNLIDSNYFKRLFEPAIKIGEKYNVRLYCGEYGVIDNVSDDSALNWFNDIHKAFSDFGIAHSVWTYKEKDFGILKYEKSLKAFINHN